LATLYHSYERPFQESEEGEIGKRLQMREKAFQSERERKRGEERGRERERGRWKERESKAPREKFAYINFFFVGFSARRQRPRMKEEEEVLLFRNVAATERNP
jgi:hypothetical protein